MAWWIVNVGIVGLWMAGFVLLRVNARNRPPPSASDSWHG